MADPTLSIIIASYQREELLCACLRSLMDGRARGYRDFEVLVVDDCGGQTGRAEAMSDLVDTRFLRMEQNSGQPAAQMAAVASARGEILAFLDDDAVAVFDWPGEIVRYFRANPEIGAVLGRIEALNTKKLLARTRQVIYDKRHKKYLSPVFQQELKQTYSLRVGSACLGLSDHVSGGSFAIRAETLRQVGGLPVEVRMGCDMELSRRLLEGGVPIGYDPQMIIRHLHNASYRVLFRNSFHEGRDWVRIALSRGERRRVLLGRCVSNLLAAPFRILRFPEMLTADRWKIRAYGVFTLIQFFDGIGRLYELSVSNGRGRKRA